LLTIWQPWNQLAGLQAPTTDGAGVRVGDLKFAQSQRLAYKNVKKRQHFSFFLTHVRPCKECFPTKPEFSLLPPLFFSQFLSAELLFGID
jgi:hypothetical protein